MCPSLPNFRWQLIKWAKPLFLYMKVVCAHIIGTDHFLFNVARVIIIFYIVLITITLLIMNFRCCGYHYYGGYMDYIKRLPLATAACKERLNRSDKS